MYTFLLLHFATPFPQSCMPLFPRIVHHNPVSKSIYGSIRCLKMHTNTQKHSNPPRIPFKSAPSSNDPSEKKGKSIAERDRELHQLLLDRDGGGHAVGIVGGQYESGLGVETKKNMFRII